MSADTWEARMAARARLRSRKIEREVADAERVECVQTQQPWMNGWPRISISAMLIGTGVHCVGCGHCMGITCVAFPEDWEPPGPDPAWPFGEADCPVCRP